MLQTALDTEPSQETKSERDIYLSAFRFMLLARLLDDKFAALYRAGKIHGGVFLGRGQEGLSVAIGVSLKKSDVFAPLIRDAAGRLAFGETGPGCRAHLYGFVAGPDARARWQCPSRQARGKGMLADDQPSGRDDFGRERHVACAPVQENFGHRWRSLHRRRRQLPPARFTRR